MKIRMRTAAVAVLAAVEIIFLGSIRYGFTHTAEAGTAYQTPASVDFGNSFYSRSYIVMNIPLHEAQWKGSNLPRAGETIYLAAARDQKGVLYIKWAELDKPEGDYIITRARSIENGIVYFDIPFRRFYVTPEEMKKLPVSELSERVAAEDGTTGRTVTKMKNHVEAFFRLKDGQGVITDILINGVSVKKSFTTFGDPAAVSYAGAEGSAYAEGQ